MTEVLAYKARLAEQLEMYNEMKETMKELVELKFKDAGKTNNGELLTEDERNLLSVAYKNVVGQRRTSWRIVCSLEAKNDDGWKPQICREFKSKIEKELFKLCNEIIELLDSHLLLPEGDDPAEYSQQETAVFFYKMKGDYLRYQVEIAQEENRDEMKEKAKAAYTHAATIAEKHLQPTNPIRLGLALNFSVFHYEIACCAHDACELAKKAFDDAIQQLDSTPEESYKDSTLILQLLRDNLSLWTSEGDEQQEDN